MIRVPDNISVQKYRQVDFDLIQDFQIASAISMGQKFPQNQIKACTVFHDGFTSRHSQFPSYIILVAKDTIQNTVVGILSGVLKQVLTDGRLQKIGQIFWLKVLQTHQRKGIANFLCQEMQRKMKKRGVSSIFVKIDSGNIKAHSLFVSKLGYSEACTQKIKVLNPQSSAPRPKHITPQRAFKLTQEYYKNSDMNLTDLESLFHSSFYLGTYVVESSKKDMAGVSLWYASAHSDMSLIKVLINTKTLNKPQVYLGCVVLGIFLIVSFLYFGYSLFWMINAPVLRLCYAVTFIYVGFKGVNIMYVLYKYAKISIMRGKRQKARVFGYFFQGQEKVKKQLFNELIQGLKQEAIYHRLEYVLFEFDSNDAIGSVFPTHSFSRIYLQKSLDGRVAYRWSADSFLDPRD